MRAWSNALATHANPSPCAHPVAQKQVGLLSRLRFVISRWNKRSGLAEGVSVFPWVSAINTQTLSMPSLLWQAKLSSMGRLSLWRAVGGKRLSSVSPQRFWLRGCIVIFFLP